MTATIPFAEYIPHHHATRLRNYCFETFATDLVARIVSQQSPDLVPEIEASLARALPER